MPYLLYIYSAIVEPLSPTMLLRKVYCKLALSSTYLGYSILFSHLVAFCLFLVVFLTIQQVLPYQEEDVLHNVPHCRLYCSRTLALLVRLCKPTAFEPLHSTNLFAPA